MCGSLPDRHKILGLRLNQSQGRNPRQKDGIAVSVKQCRDCTLIFSDPQPVPAAMTDHYGVPPESYWQPGYFQVAEDHFAGQIDRASILLGGTRGKRALDVGAGIGKNMIALSAAGFDVEGIEPSPPFRDRAIGKMGIPAERLHPTSVEDARFPPGSFDLVSFSAVLEHLYSPGQAIERALTWLRPGGVIHIEVPASNYLMARIVNAYFSMRGTNYVTNISPMHAPFHLFEFGLKSFAAHGNRVGYSIVHQERFVASIYNMPALLHPPLSYMMERTNTGMQLVVWLSARAGSG